MKVHKIYSEYARVYHEMYCCIYDYEEEFEYYHKQLSKLKCKKILELGSGSGNLAKQFIANGYDYTGIDSSKEMIALSKEFIPEGKFIRGDMRHLNLGEEFDAIIVTGRTFTHMTTNHDVMFALDSVDKHLKKEGWLLFDNFSAYEIFTNFKEEMEHTASYNNRKYARKSYTSFDLEHGWTWRWKAIYEIEEDGKSNGFEDEMILRAFTEDELRLFLRLTGFRVEELTLKENAILTIAQKVNDERTNAEMIYFKQKNNQVG